MADMCSVTYKIVGDGPRVKSIYKVLQYMERRKTAVVKNTWGKMWLGCLVAKLGGDCEACGCRGVITGFWLEDTDEYVLTIEQETDWREQADVRHLITQLFRGVKVYYQELRSGMSAFITNDANGRYFPERYFIDSHEDWYFFATIEEVAAFAEVVVGHDVKPELNIIYNALLDYQDEHYEDDEVFYSLHEIEVVR